MTGSTPTTADLDRMAAAADWLVRLHDAPGDEALAVAWLQWCEEDPRNLQEFSSAQLVWHAANPAAPEAPLAEPEVSPPPVVRRRLNRPVWLGLAATVLIAVGIGSFAFLRTDKDELLQSYATPIAGTGSSVLPDGSRVELGADSRITTRYTTSQRFISVDVGEAYFLVAKDPGRPFLVDAGGMRVTAVGTAFNVRRNSDRVVISVSEGRVQLNSGNESADDAVTSKSARTPLLAGQQAIYSSDSRTVTIAQIDAMDVASWRTGVLKYMHEPLGSVAQDLSRYHNKRIIISDARLSAMPFTGTVFSSRIDDTLKALESVFPLQVRERGDAIELVPRG